MSGEITMHRDQTTNFDPARESGGATKMEWQRFLAIAEEEQDPAKADELYSKAVTSAQCECGPHHANLAQCLMAYASFLERERRFGDAILRYKLAAAIFKKFGQERAFNFAQGKVLRMEVLNKSNPH
jgi:hypothetical protein